MNENNLLLFKTQSEEKTFSICTVLCLISVYFSYKEPDLQVVVFGFFLKKIVLSSGFPDSLKVFHFHFSPSDWD